MSKVILLAVGMLYGLSGYCGGVSLQLLDAQSAKPIANREVKIHSDNGMRCIQAPCGTESKSWSGLTNQEGFIEIPSEFVNRVTSLTCAGYSGGRGLDNKEPSASGGFVLELEPDALVSKFQRRFKLVNAKTTKPLVNASVWIVHEEACTPPACKAFTFAGKTNSLGNVFYPISETFPVKYPSYWIYSPGYKAVIPQMGWVNFKILLDPK